MSILKNCSFPELDEKFSIALREVIEFVEKRFSPILGIIAAGSIMRGEGDANTNVIAYIFFV